MNIRSKYGGSRGRGRGRGGNTPGKGRRRPPAGPGGTCICVNPECQKEEDHKAGVPCYKMKCPVCGSPMVRKEE